MGSSQPSFERSEALDESELIFQGRRPSSASGSSAWDLSGRCGGMTVVVKGLEGAFLKTLSICSRRCVARYLEFEMIRVKRNGDFLKAHGG
jgi:hypothetical protein